MIRLIGLAVAGTLGAAYAGLFVGSLLVQLAAGGRPSGRNPARLFLLPADFVVRRIRFAERFPQLYAPVYRRSARQAGGRPIVRLALDRICLMGTGMWAAGVAGGGLMALDPQPFYGGAALAIAALVPVVMLQRWDRSIERRRQLILLDLPPILGHIALLVGAGETVPQAFAHATERSRIAKDRPLMRELRQACKLLENHAPFAEAMERLNRSCGVQEVSVLTATVLTTYRRGGEECSTALRKLARELWSKRKARARTLGEEASAKLVFPMMVIFVAILMIVAAPAILSINP